MNQKLMAQARKLLASYDADLIRNGSGQAMIVKARYGEEATKLLRQIVADDDAKAHWMSRDDR